MNESDLNPKSGFKSQNWVSDPKLGCVKTLPELPHNAQYRCVFGNATRIHANVMKEGLLCTSSPVNERPTIGDGLDHVLVPLSVRNSETNKDFVSRSLAFYDCTRKDSCRMCLVSNWGCHWCI
uniref:Plexin TIG domain-containing protein n=1 Tax=Anopheles atroparvus TaxID=41427 RepID=A0A182IM52_ANOAO